MFKANVTLKRSWFDLLQNCNPPHQWVFSHCAHPENIHTMYFPHKRDWNFLGGGRFCKTQKCKEMCDAIIIDMKWQVLLSLHCRMNATPSPPSFLPDPFSLKFPHQKVHVQRELWSSELTRISSYSFSHWKSISVANNLPVESYFLQQNIKWQFTNVRKCT